jgi:hypothetical protein
MSLHRDRDDDNCTLGQFLGGLVLPIILGIWIGSKLAVWLFG